MAKLVAFYSRADENYFGGAYRYIEVGNTEKVARMIAEEIGADLFKIEQTAPYAADYQTCIAQAKADLQANARPELVAMPDSLDAYDEVYLGYPIYWGTMPMAVYTFLEALDCNGKTIHPFCTHEGSGAGKTAREIGRAARGADVTGVLSLYGSDVDAARPAVERWLRS